jgi:hypothetical protein
MNDDITPLEVLAESLRNVRAHLGTVGLYIALWLPAGLLAVGAAFLRPSDPAAPLDPARQSAFFMVDLVYAALHALAASVAFSRLGRELDKPLWKVPTDGEAVRRFFMLWFTMLLALTAADRVAFMVARTTGEETFYLVALMLLLVGNAFMFVAGACVMFHGRHEWSELGEALGPVGRFPAHTMLFVLLGFAAYMVLVLAIQGLPRGLQLLPMLVSTLVDCIIFAGAWQVCRIHRDAPPANDFDF